MGGRVGSAGGLIVGHGDSEAFLASDLPAVVRHTRDFQVVEAGEIVALRSDGADFQDLHNRSRQRRLISVPWGPMAAAKAGHRHFMHKEIHEQPETLADTIRPRVTLEPAELRLHDFQLPITARDIERVVIVASGSSHFAGMIGSRYLRELAHLPTTTEVASEFAYAPGPLSRETLVIAISQSGATARRAAGRGARTSPAARRWWPWSIPSAANSRERPTPRSTCTRVLKSASPPPRRSYPSLGRSICWPVTWAFSKAGCRPTSWPRRLADYRARPNRCRPRAAD